MILFHFYHIIQFLFYLTRCWSLKTTARSLQINKIQELRVGSLPTACLSFWCSLLWVIFHFLLRTPVAINWFTSHMLVIIAAYFYSVLHKWIIRSESPLYDQLAQICKDCTVRGGPQFSGGFIPHSDAMNHPYKLQKIQCSLRVCFYLMRCTVWRPTCDIPCKAARESFLRGVSSQPAATPCALTWQWQLVFFFFLKLSLDVEFAFESCLAFLILIALHAMI